MSYRIVISRNHSWLIQVLCSFERFYTNILCIHSWKEITKFIGKISHAVSSTVNLHLGSTLTCDTSHSLTLLPNMQITCNSKNICFRQACTGQLSLSLTRQSGLVMSCPCLIMSTFCSLTTIFIMYYWWGLSPMLDELYLFSF